MTENVEIKEIEIRLDGKLHCVISDDTYAQDIIMAIRKVYLGTKITTKKTIKNDILQEV